MTRLLLIDDDDATREVLAVLLRGDGWAVTPAACGEDAVAIVAEANPEVILCDLQMPGLSGPGLSAALRHVVSPGTIVLAMTATPGNAVPDGFDGLLVKPFPPESVRQACAGAVRPPTVVVSIEAIDVRVFDRMKQAMPAAQLKALYDFALADAAKRLTSMAAAARAADDASFRRDAHALKGSCGMVGAARLDALAARAEETGVPSFTESNSAEFSRELSAVQRMLEELFPSAE